MSTNRRQIFGAVLAGILGSLVVLLPKRSKASFRVIQAQEGPRITHRIRWKQYSASTYLRFFSNSAKTVDVRRLYQALETGVEVCDGGFCNRKACCDWVGNNPKIFRGHLVGYPEIKNRNVRSIHLLAENLHIETVS